MQTFCPCCGRPSYQRLVLSQRSELRPNISTVFPCMGVAIIKIRRSWDRLIYIMGVPLLAAPEVSRGFLIIGRHPLFKRCAVIGETVLATAPHHWSNIGLCRTTQRHTHFETSGRIYVRMFTNKSIRQLERGSVLKVCRNATDTWTIGHIHCKRYMRYMNTFAMCLAGSHNMMVDLL